MYKELFGFLIDNEIQLDIKNRRLIRINTTPEKAVTFSLVLLNETMVQILVFLLKNAKNNEPVYKREILKQVWDEYDYSSSSQRLWKVVKDLRVRLAVIGVPHDFIFIDKGCYSLNSQAVTALFYE